MSGNPYYKKFPADYWTDTHHLSLAAHGLYNLMLDYQWQNGSIPANFKSFSRYLGKDPRDIERIFTRELAEFFDLNPGNPRDYTGVIPRELPRDYTENTQGNLGEYSNPKLEQIRKQRNINHEDRVESGRKGGLAKARNFSYQKPSIPESESEKSSSMDGSYPDTPLPIETKTLCSADQNSNSDQNPSKPEDLSAGAALLAGGNLNGKTYKTKKGRTLQGWQLREFELMLDGYFPRTGKAAAADAWLDVVTTQVVAALAIDGAKSQSLINRDRKSRGSTMLNPQGYISGRRWEDDSEIEKRVSAEKPQPQDSWIDRAIAEDERKQGAAERKRQSKQRGAK